MEETALIKQAQDGDLDSFEVIIRRHESNIYNLALLLTHNDVEAEEVAQQVLVKIWKKLGKFKFKSSFNTWAYRITHNTFYDYLRKKSRLRECAEELPVLTDSANPYDALETEERRKIVGAALKKLPDKFRRAVIMYDFEGLSYEEISKILNRSVGTVKSRLFRARALLRKELGNFFDNTSV
ncbi:MAG: sigma-70 family RNA polymerase sigma factor [Elusimicrobia bacterium]|nr:sigma-70 family RNA polymerase sigma factor [Elusimicrobiota bacterium]